MSDYAKVNLRDIENAVAGRAEGLEARFARGPLESRDLGVSLFEYEPDVRSPFNHSHGHQEEAYVVVRGSGRMRVDGEVLELREWDTVRLAPAVIRGFEAGPDGMDVIAIGGPLPEGGRDGQTERRAVARGRRRMRRAALLALALLVPFAAAVGGALAATRRVSRGTIVIGAGAAGVRLGMTRAQVVHALGAPVHEDDGGLMSYQPASSTTLFDVQRAGRAGRVTSVLVSGFHGRAFRLKPTGIHPFTTGAIARLARHYGKRLRRVYDAVGDLRYYVLRTGRALTAFEVDRFTPSKARVIEVFLRYA